MKHKTKSDSSPFIRQEGFERLLSEYSSLVDGQKISNFLNDRRFTVKSTENTYRLINHWESKGLLPKVRKNTKEWRKFSMVDLVWLGTIRALREYGYPLKKIKSGFDQMNEWYSELSNSSDMHIVEHYITRFIVLGLGFYCIAFSDGVIDFIDDEEYFVNEWIASKVDHIKISGAPIFNKFFPGDDIKVKPSLWVNLTDEEYKVIGAIRNPDIKEILIKGRNGKVEILERTQILDPKSRLGDVLREDDYQELKIKRAKGEVVKLTRTISDKFK